MSKRKTLRLFWLFPSLIALFSLFSCRPAGQVLATMTPAPEPTCAPEAWPCASDSLTLTAAPALHATATLVEAWPSTGDSLTLTFTPPALDPPTPDCPWPCAQDSLTLTAAMGATLGAIPTNTPLPWATILPSATDLGWGTIHGHILDGLTFAPISGASVRCEHLPYTPYPCMDSTVTTADGAYAFTGIFFREADRILLIVEAPGYAPLRFEQTVHTYPELYADLGLEPWLTPTAPPATLEPMLMCTPPACDGGQLACGLDTGCPGGCGTVCTYPTP